MTSQQHPDQDRPESPRGYTAGGAQVGWAQRRREKVVAEIQRNRRGEYRVPTWVLALVLALFVAGWLALVLLS